MSSLTDAQSQSCGGETLPKWDGRPQEKIASLLEIPVHFLLITLSPPKTIKVCWVVYNYHCFYKPLRASQLFLPVFFFLMDSLQICLCRQHLKVQALGQAVIFFLINRLLQTNLHKRCTGLGVLVLLVH